jgi:hypothetical protein
MKSLMILKDQPLESILILKDHPNAGVALGKGEVGDHPRPHPKIRPHSKYF